MHSVQSVSKQSKLSRRQRRLHLNRAASHAAVFATAAASSSSSSSGAAATAAPRYSGYKIAKTYRNTVPIVHGIVVSNLSLVLLQKEYIEQFYFEKRSGGGGPDPDANADSYRHLKIHNNHHLLLTSPTRHTRTIKACYYRPLIRFG